MGSGSQVPRFADTVSGSWFARRPRTFRVLRVLRLRG